MIREHRLRLQAELQRLYSELKNLREREAEHIKSTSGTPQFTADKIREARQNIARIEDELQEGEKPRAQQLYWDGFAAELAGDTKKAMRLYKQAARQKYPDAKAALRSVRHRAGVDNSLQWAGLAGLAALILITSILLWWSSANKSGPRAAPTLTLIPTAPAGDLTARAPVLPTPSSTSRPTAGRPPTPSSAPRPTASRPPTPLPPSSAPPPQNPTDSAAKPLPGQTPTEMPPQRPAPNIIGPPDNLVWQGGAVVFEFENMNLANDEIYCLNTLRGFDESGTENWSYPIAESKSPSIVINANVFLVAQTQGMQCVTWQAYIGQRSCDIKISKLTNLRVIGLPDPCNFD